MKYYALVRDVEPSAAEPTSRIIDELNRAPPFDYLVESTQPISIDARVETMFGEPRWVLKPARSARLRCVFFFNRKDGMSRRDFLGYWHHRHAPLVPRTPGLAGYLQCALVASAPYDAVTELYWSDRASLDRSLRSDELNREQAEDAERFVDGASIVRAFVAGPWCDPDDGGGCAT